MIIFKLHPGNKTRLRSFQSYLKSGSGFMTLQGREIVVNKTSLDKQVRFNEGWVLSCKIPS